MKSNRAINIWTAAFWEGEGHCSKNRESGYTVGICQTIDENRTTLSAMRLIKKNYGGRLYYNKPDNLKYKLQIRWQISERNDIINFLRNIYPYCLIRQKQVADVIDYYNNTEFKTKNNLKFLQRIKKYLKKNYTYQRISKKLGCKISDSTVCRIIQKYNLLEEIK
jgi:hypothetical protein